MFLGPAFCRSGVLLADDEYRTLEEFPVGSKSRCGNSSIAEFAPLSPGSAAIQSGINDPFHGLEAYDFEHAPIFFGSGYPDRSPPLACAG
jgi:hypothetical protein